MRRLINAYNKLEANVLVVSLAVTVVVIFFQVIMRYVFNNSLSWSEEFARYVFIWQIWLGASVSLKEDDHISVDVISGKLGPRGKCLLALFANLVLLGFSIFIVDYGWQMVSSMYSRNLTSAALRVPMYLVYAALPFSHMVIVLRLIGRIIGNVKTLTSGTEKEGT